MNLLTLDSLVLRFNMNLKMSEKKKIVITSFSKDNW